MSDTLSLPDLVDHHPSAPAGSESTRPALHEPRWVLNVCMVRFGRQHRMEISLTWETMFEAQNATRIWQFAS
jgi:hypothetical protein